MNAFRYLLKPKMLLAGVGLAVASIIGLSIVSSPAFAALPEDCDDNAIIKCGFQDKNGFKSDYLANKTGDLKNLYADSRFNFSSDEMDRFMKNAVWARAYKDGRIVLDDGRTVATGAWSIGRKKFNDQRVPIVIAGKTYYTSSTQNSFAANSIRALVMMDKDNKYMEFAVLTACGNPITGVKPEFYCKELKHTKKSNTQYEFWSEAVAKNGASVKSVVYNFGDGTTATRSKPSDKVSKTYAKAGNYTVTVTVTYNVHGKEYKETVQTKCKTQIKVEEEKKPIAQCKSIQAQLIQGRKYRFTTTVEFKDGPKPVSADFDFGDGQKATGLKNFVTTSATTATISTEHQYAETLEGEKTITSNITFTNGSDNNNPNCQTKITLKKELKPEYKCSELDAKLIQGNRKYRFVATATFKDGPQPTSAEFDFGDGQKATLSNFVTVNATTATVATEHQYAAELEGEKTITVDITFTHGADKKNSECQAKITLKKETCEDNPERPECKPKECKPGIPVGDDRCKEECKPGIPVGDDRCEDTPHVLPSTGPAEIIGSAIGLTGVVAAGTYYVGSRRNLLGSLLNR